MKLLCLIMCICLMVVGSAFSMTIRADAYPLAGIDSIPLGDSYIDIYMNNDDGFYRNGYSMPYAIYSPDGSITEISHRNVNGEGPYGSFLPVNGFECGGFWDYLCLYDTWSWDGVLPDTFCFSGLGFTDGMPPGLGERLYLRIALNISTEGIICIDSIDHPDDSYDWVFEAPSPSFGGPYCWTVVENFPDIDDDGIADILDNCPTVYNPQQEDSDFDSMGDSCDPITPLFEGTPVTGYVPLNVNFSNNTISMEPITDWLWDFGDEYTSADSSPTHTYDLPRDYSVSLIASNSSGADTLVYQSYVSAHDGSYFRISQLFSNNIFNIRAVDMDFDNNTDLLFSSLPNSQLYISYGYGNGSFTYPIQLPPDHIDFAYGFINDDTLLDIVSADYSEVAIMLNLGNRNYSTSYISHSGAEINAIAFGYFDNDQYIDMAVGPSEVYFGDGTGAFPQSITLSTSFEAAEISDFNNDGFDDILLVGDSIAIYTSNGSRGFVLSDWFGISGLSVSATTANSTADFNRDGNSDFAVIVPKPPSGQLTHAYVYIGLGDGEGHIDNLDSIYIDGIALYVAAADVNRDNKLDLITCNGTERQLEIYHGDGLGSFEDSIAIGLETDEFYLSFTEGDFNRDGNPDFVVGPWLWDGIIDLLLLTNQLSPAPILDDELQISGLNSVALQIQNPDAFAISRYYTTVAGADYWRYDLDNNGNLDNATIDYNVQYGEYKIIICNSQGLAVQFLPLRLVF